MYDDENEVDDGFKQSDYGEDESESSDVENKLEEEYDLEDENPEHDG